MKEYYVSFVIRGAFNNDFKSCFITTDKPLNEKRIEDFRQKIANEVKLNLSEISILGLTLLDEVEA